MSTDSRCAFCTRLPTTALGTGGKSAKCPLCKSELIVNRWTGVTYRVGSSDEVDEVGTGVRRSWIKRASVLSVVTVTSVAVAVGLVLLESDDKDPGEKPAASEIVAAKHIVKLAPAPKPLVNQLAESPVVVVAEEATPEIRVQPKPLPHKPPAAPADGSYAGYATDSA